MIAIFVFVLLGGDLLAVANAKTKWLSGQVVATSLNGHGSETDSWSNTVRRKDIWWNYSISANGQCYSLSSRESPTKIGLTQNSEVKFYTIRNQFYVLDPNGERVALRIIRSAKTKTCP